jgi:uncharacterized protein
VLMNLVNPWYFETWSQYKLGDKWPETTHEKFMQITRDYMFHGGMPAVVKAKFAGKSYSTMTKLQNDIHQTYRDDFSKHAKSKQTEVLQICFDSIPSTIGQKLKYSFLSQSFRAEILRPCIQLLHLAGVVKKVHHRSGQALPLAAYKNEKIYKLFWLDIGLLNRALGLSAQKISSQLIQEGVMAEQFVSQHLLGLGDGLRQEQLFYWIREGQAQNAEVDFLLQVDGEILPLEVKSGRAGRLKSLNQFVLNMRSRRGIKLSGGLPALQTIEAENLPNQDLKPAQFTLMELPLYFAERLTDILQE